ncbi:MAG: hypothetical protein ACM3L9_09415 [Deltaproteobacteria bacterium]
MTAVSMSSPLARSGCLRVRAVPSLAKGRPAAARTIERQSSSTTNAGAAAVSRAFANHAAAPRVPSKPKKSDAIEFRLIYSIAFAVFLLTSVIERAMPHKWAQRPGESEVRKSVFEQAREAAHISAAYAFMG